MSVKAQLERLERRLKPKAAAAGVVATVEIDPSWSDQKRKQTVKAADPGVGGLLLVFDPGGTEPTGADIGATVVRFTGNISPTEL